jgi:hypothetical protein
MSILNKKIQIPTVQVGKEKAFTVIGKSFFKTTNVYLSGLPVENQSTFFNPFTNVSKLSAKYPGFLGLQLPVSAYNSNNYNVITFTLPVIYGPGFVDVIVENPAGYGTLTQYAIKGTYNPYVPGTTQYAEYEPYVRPWGRGIRVIGISQPVPGEVYIIDFNGDPLYTIDGLTIKPIE